MLNSKIVAAFFALFLFSLNALAIHSGTVNSSSQVSKVSISLRLSTFNKNTKTFEDKHNCGGSFLSSKYILTAGHCVFGLTNPTKDMSVYSGSDSLSKQKKIATVVGVHLHPEFEEYRPEFLIYGEEKVSYLFSGRNDIAILEVAPVPGEESRIHPIDLPLQDPPKFFEFENLPLDTTYQVQGWGKTDNETSPDRLQVIDDLSLFSETGFSSISEIPDDVYKRLYGIHPTHTRFSLHNYYNEGGLFVFYSHNANSIVCSGDSGSPIIAIQNNSMQIVGLVSSTMDFRCGGHIDNSALGVNVYEYLAWISQITNKK